MLSFFCFFIHALFSVKILPIFNIYFQLKLEEGRQEVLILLDFLARASGGSSPRTYVCNQIVCKDVGLYCLSWDLRQDPSSSISGPLLKY